MFYQKFLTPKCRELLVEHDIAGADGVHFTFIESRRPWRLRGLSGRL
jgi:hypothetical protein